MLVGILQLLHYTQAAGAAAMAQTQDFLLQSINHFVLYITAITETHGWTCLFANARIPGKSGCICL